MQQSDVYYQLLSQHVSGIIMPIFRTTKTVCYCIRCTALVLLDVIGSGCGALRGRMWAVIRLIFTQIKHTIATGLILLTQTTTVCLIRGTIYRRFWFSFILFIIITGGDISAIYIHNKLSLKRNIFTSSARILQRRAHNRYQPHPAEPAQYTVCSNTRSLFSWRWA